jgi:hypothetical protein
MSLPEFLLEASRVLIGLGLAVFIGVPLAGLFGRMTIGEDLETEKEEKIFLEGGEESLSRPGPSLPLPFLSNSSSSSSSSSSSLGRARFVAAGGVLVGVLLEVQVMGSALAPRHVARAVVLFVLVASLVYSVMVVAPKARYYDERSSAFEENLRAPWHARRDAALLRGSRIDLVGFLLALVALVLG